MDILILPGDGIGPETTAATMKVLNAVNDKYSLGLALSQRGDRAGYA